MSIAAVSPPYADTTEPFASPNRIEFDIEVTGGAGGIFAIDAAFLESYFATFPRPPANLLRMFSQPYATDAAASDAIRPLEYSAVPSIAVGATLQPPPARRLGRNQITGRPEFQLSSGNVDGQWRVCLRLPVSAVG